MYVNQITFPFKTWTSKFDNLCIDLALEDFIVVNNDEKQLRLIFLLRHWVRVMKLLFLIPNSKNHTTTFSLVFIEFNFHSQGQFPNLTFSQKKFFSHEWSKIHLAYQIVRWLKLDSFIECDWKMSSSRLEWIFRRQILLNKFQKKMTTETFIKSEILNMLS